MTFLQGCISISMTLHQTSFCFVCSHLASGEKEGDELKRNADVVEILKGTQFPKICKNPNRRPCERIIHHEYVLPVYSLLGYFSPNFFIHFFMVQFVSNESNVFF